MEKSVFYLRSFLFFFHASATIIISYLPLYFQHKGLTGGQIGLLLAIGPFAMLFTQPFWGYMTDKYRTVKRFILLCLVLMIISSIFLFYTTEFTFLLIIAAIFFSFQGPISALTDSLSQKTSSNLNISFGSIRTWGSIGFAATALLGGQLLGVFGIQYISFLFLLFSGIAFFVALKISDVAAEGRPVKLADTKKVLGNMQLVSFLVIAFFISTTHRTNDSFIGLYINELGGSESIVGWGWFIAVGSEALIYATSSLWFKKYHEITFIIIAGVLFVVRWYLYSIADSPMFLVSLQALHGICFGIFYLSAFQYVTKLLPRELIGTGHLFFVTVIFGLSGILGNLFGGQIFDVSGGDVLYKYLTFCAIIGTIGLIVYKIIIDKFETTLEKQKLAKNTL